MQPLHDTAQQQLARSGNLETYKIIARVFLRACILYTCLFYPPGSPKREPSIFVQWCVISACFCFVVAIGTDKYGAMMQCYYLIYFGLVLATVVAALHALLVNRVYNAVRLAAMNTYCQ